jgi:hypothetical protein
MLGRNKKEEAAHDLGLEAGKIAADAFPGMLSSHTHPFASQVMQDNGIKKNGERMEFCAGYGEGVAEGKIEQVKQRWGKSHG